MLSWLNNRIPPVIIFALALAAMYALNNLPAGKLFFTGELFWISLILLILGASFVVASVYQFKTHHTTVDPRFPDKAETLITDGIFRYSRNPIYLGLSIMLLAAACYFGSLLTLLGVVAFMLYMQIFQIIPEEHAIERLFEDSYRQYKRDVNRWF